MKLSAAAALLLTSTLPFAQAHYKGFNIGANKPDGSCKLQADWENNFNVMKSLPGGFKTVRLYASSDCNTLQQAVPAAINTGIKLLVGVWTEDATHYNNEKNALKAAMSAYPISQHPWMAAVSVGSEDLYRGDTNAQTLAGQVYDVRGMISQPQYGGSHIAVGHVDTWTAWVNGANYPVIKACDFIGMDAYPYFQGTAIGSSKQTLYDAISATKSAASQAGKPNIPVWVTETGWPVSGPSDGAAVASVSNAQYYWKQVVCSLFSSYSVFAYTLRDYNASPSFGVLNQNFGQIYSLTC